MHLPEDGPLIRQLLFLLLLIMVNFVFSCFEIAVISTGQTKLDKLSAGGDRRAARLLGLTKLPSKFLATIQVGSTLAGFLASAFAAKGIAARLTRFLIGAGLSFAPNTINNISIVLVTLALSYFSIVLGELVPKRIAMKYAERISLTLSGPIRAVSILFAPVVFFLSASANILLGLIRIRPDAPEEEITEEEIRMMVDAGSETGAIDEEEKDIIHNVFEFGNLTAADVMTHRTNIVSLWLEEDGDKWDETVSEHKFTCYPICGEDQDDIVGVLNTKDYFRLKDKSRVTVMAQAVRPAQFVPESVRSDMLFRNMKKNRSHFSVVLDEYGGMSGVVTMNDLLEELVGDLEDDQSAPPDKPRIEKIDDLTWKVGGTVSLSELSDELGVQLPTDEYDSFAAFVFGLLGTIPEDGQTPELDEYGLHVRVAEIKEHRLEGALVSIIRGD
ncbi:MAG: hemolysin family protein [Defluviitaleaceae bacterium]|nr:hemolysin family protein [Defluviitaleaceae bacterium]